MEAADLAHQLARASKAKATVSKYESYWNMFTAWAESHDLASLPASPQTVALYLATCSKTDRSISVFNSKFYAIRWKHNLCGLDDPCSNSLPSMVLEGCRRTARAQPRKKAILGTSFLIELCSKFGSEDSTLRDLRLCCMAVLAYSGFLRISEVLRLRFKDITLFDSHICLMIRTSKTDYYSKGQEVTIAPGSTVAAPRVIVDRYFRKANLAALLPESYIFRTLKRGKKGFSLGSTNKPMCYNRAREDLKFYLKRLGLDADTYGWHCLRRGGASSAAKANIPDRLFKSHGRWRSETAKDGYVSDSLANRLSVSKSLLL